MTRWRSEKAGATPGASPQRRTLAQWWAWFKAQLRRLFVNDNSEIRTRRGGLGRTGTSYRVGS